MNAFSVIAELIKAHGGRIPVVVVGGPEGGAVPKNHLQNGCMELDKSYKGVIRFREYYAMPWQYPPARLHGEPYSEWVRYAREHVPGAAVVRRAPWAYNTPEDERANLQLLSDLLQYTPRLFDAVPGLREAAENLLLLEELI